MDKSPWQQIDEDNIFWRQHLPEIRTRRCESCPNWFRISVWSDSGLKRIGEARIRSIRRTGEKERSQNIQRQLRQYRKVSDEEKQPLSYGLDRS